MTWATRAQVQTSPRKPYASGPCPRKSGMRRFRSSVSLGGCPGERRLKRASGPPPRARASQRLTVSSEAPRASAMSRWDQPCCFRCNARNLRHSRQSSGKKSDGATPVFYESESLTAIAQRSVRLQLHYYETLLALAEQSLRNWIERRTYRLSYCSINHFKIWWKE